MGPISAVYSEGKVVVPTTNEASSLYQDGYGSMLPEGGALTLQTFETLYLVEIGKLITVDETSHERLVFQELLKKFSTGDPHTWIRYIVYRDIRTRGFVTKKGWGTGIDFLVYERGSYGKKTPSYLVYAVWEGNPEPIDRLNEVLTIAEKKEKILRLAVVDRRGEVVYYTLTKASLQKSAI
jgi:tRNA-intron endonuclease